MSADRRTHDERLAEILMTRDVGCLKCGYNLRGLFPGGRCPECGTPVVRSVAPPLLERVDPAWVRGAARGTGLVSVGLLVWVVMATALGAFGLVLFLMLKLDLGATGWTTPNRIAGAIAGVGGAGGFVLVVAGQWLASRAQRELDADLPFLLWRRGVRLAFGTLVGVAAVGGIGVGVLSVLEVSRRMLWLGTDLYFPGIALGCVVVIAVFVGYLQEVLVRAPDAGLGRRCAACTRLMVAGVVVALVGFQLSNTLLVPLGRWAQGIGWAATVVGFVGAAGATAWLSFGLAACGRRLRACRREAGRASVDHVQDAA
jgi:hypothetical protein